jgi:flagellar biosynthesis/type III secretory pathway protein FliH
VGWFDDQRSGKARAIDFANTGKVEGEAAKSVDFNQLAVDRGTVPEEIPIGLDEISSSFVADGPPAAKWQEKDLEEARQRGYEEGFDDGRATAEQVVDEMRQELEHKMAAVVDEIAEFEQRAVKHINAVAATLARAYAENFLRRTLREDEDLAVRIGADVIRRAAGFETIHVYVHPEMAGVLQQRRFELRPEDPVGDSLKIHPDDSMTFGDVRLMADGGQIEARIDERLEQLVAAARMELDSIDGPADFSVDEEAYEEGDDA